SSAIVGEVPAQAGGLAAAGPWQIARKRLLRNRVALTMAALLLVIVALCLCAPLYARHIAHTNPFESNLNGTTVVNGKSVPVMEDSTTGLGLGVTPIGPTWDVHHYFLGADEQGRDVAARVLYGGRSSLEVGIGSAVLCCVVATIIAMLSGFYGGVFDSIISRIMDVIWAFPVNLPS